MTTLILVRHAQSEGNRDRRFTTTHETPITELGREQARIAAARARELFSPTLIVSSPYKRAIQTAEIIASELALATPLQVEPDLREQNLGELAGLPYEAVRDDPSFNPLEVWKWRPPGGETREEVRDRAAPVLDRLARTYRGRDIIIVSHGGVMAALWAHITGSWEGAFIPPNAGIYAVRHDGTRYLQPFIVEVPQQAESRQAALKGHEL